MVVKFETYFDGKYWCARGIGVDIFTQGNTLDELMDNIKEATALHFEKRVTKNIPLNIITLSEMEVPSAVKTASR
ncbi:type II toxin-antitoxin system HicB family antitoxin [candidate division WOR-3 bacterium]|nr:type II toxin-antitoxin system HicB family antitoxin [candidate division WOR-3 bacterium]